ncbi:MAG: methylisocitrate lyase [Alphaproteobacteria bacterium]|nr:methylisocitrate lyase [Alphaproteobacteria bacterium]
MLHINTTPEQRRKAFRDGLNSGKLLRFPGAIMPVVAMQIEQIGFDGVYISGGVMANELGFPDLGITTLTEVSMKGYAVARATNLPTIIDIDTGFGEPMSVARTIVELTQLGLAGCHMEDQYMPKRCGHLDNKEVVPTADMVRKIKAGVDAKSDPNFVLIARTDARAVEWLDKTIDRIKAYVDAGADMIFPEAMQNESEFEAIREAVDVPLLANMTEFGKTKLLNTQQLTDLGYNLVIYPVTTLRLAMKAIEDGLTQIYNEGTQENVVPMMQPRSRLYEVIHYEDYNEFDTGIFNFDLANNTEGN